LSHYQRKDSTGSWPIVDQVWGACVCNLSNLSYTANFSRIR